VSKIFLCGGSANLKSLDQFCQMNSKSLWKSQSSALLENAPTDLSEEQKALLPQMAVAVGLATRREGIPAMIRINLLPRRWRRRPPRSIQSSVIDRRDHPGLVLTPIHLGQIATKDVCRLNPHRSKASLRDTSRSLRRWKPWNRRKSSSHSERASFSSGK